MLELARGVAVLGFIGLLLDVINERQELLRDAQEARARCEAEQRGLLEESREARAYLMAEAKFWRESSEYSRSQLLSFLDSDGEEEEDGQGGDEEGLETDGLRLPSGTWSTS